MKFIFLILVVLLLTSCHKEPVYQWRDSHVVVLEKSMHESWSGDEFYIRMRSVPENILEYEKIDKPTYYGCHIGDTINIPDRVQVGTQTEWF